MPRIQISLLAKIVLTLAAAGLLPLSIGFYQARTHKDAVLEQAQRTHMVAAKTAAARLDAFVEPFMSVARAVTANPVIHGDARSPAAAEVLSGILQGQPAIAALGIYNATGVNVILAQRRELPEALAAALPPPEGGADSPAVDLLETDGRWLRLREPLPEGLGAVVLLAEAEASLDGVIVTDELGDEAEFVVAGRDRRVLFGSESDLAAFPTEVVDMAATGKLQSGGIKHPGGELGEQIMGYAPVRQAPWFVLSRQPAAIAEVARQRIARSTQVAMALSLGFTALLSLAAWQTVVKPLRRLARAQQNLLGDEAVVPQGSEIAQLEASFAQLEQRVRDREEMDKVFLGRYQVIELIGSGAMGSVFKGFDPRLERAVALKTVRLASDEFKRQKLVATLLKEAVTSARFNHPNIVTVYDAASEGAAAFIAMEFVEGISLAQWVASKRQLGWRQVVPLGAAVARGLEAAHHHDLVHQDVKPANILLGRDHSIKITDFGISQLLSSAAETQDVICGTPGYIAPESLEGGGYSAKSDLFALGVLLYECLSGQHPFAGKNLRFTVLNTLHHDPPPPREIDDGIPAELADLVMALLAKDPDQRPADARTVALVLEKMALELDLSWADEALPASHQKAERSFQTQLISLRSTQAIGAG